MVYSPAIATVAQEVNYVEELKKQMVLPAKQNVAASNDRVLHHESDDIQTPSTIVCNQSPESERFKCEECGVVCNSSVELEDHLLSCSVLRGRKNNSNKAKL